MIVTGEHAAVLSAFLEHVTMGNWPHVLKTFREDMSYEPEELLQAWTALAEMAGVDGPEPEDFELI